MFESMTLSALQHYWWIIVSLLGSVLVFLLFVQGGQTLVHQVGKTTDERSLLINSIGRKWDLSFTTLVTFGGAFFASFPLFYATSFGGAYWVWFIILFGYILQAVSYEFRKKPNNLLGHKVYEGFLFINGVLATVLLGVAVSTFFTGSEFYVSTYNLPCWKNPARGLEALMSVQNLSLGLAVFFLSRIIGAQYFIQTIANDTIYKRAHRQLAINAIFFLVFFLTFIVMLLTKAGYTYHPVTKIISPENYKYLHNFIAMPVVLILFLAGVLLVLWGLYAGIFRKNKKAIRQTGIGTVLTVFSLFLVAGFNNTPFYPSTIHLQSSLTIENSSSSHYTLTAMSYVSLLIPLVAAYVWYVWRTMNKKKIDAEELREEEHVY